jgi:MtrB/PioB family decaheme-associated outer membrane protein
MKGRAGLLATCAVLVIGAGLGTPAFAGEKPAAAAAPMWWYDGFAEIGGRFDLNNPNKTSLGEFYRYRDLQPGVFGNFLFGAHRSGADPFDFAVWGKNAGWDDEAFGIDVASPGTYYLTFGWDQTPHVYSWDAKTTYGPLGSNVLSTPSYPGASVPPANPAPSAADVAFVNSNSTLFDLGFRRDTASAAARWTPNDNWDINADYSHTHRDGLQYQSAVTFTTPAGGFGPTRATIELPKPVDDTTQNGRINAEYAGISPWGKPFNVALGYGVSLYNNDDKSLTFKNPWNAGAAAANFPLWNQYSLWPDNQAQSVTASAGVGLPMNSRYMGTFQYSMMTQDETFLPSTVNPNFAVAVLPSSNLNGDVRTILSNNVLHTDITSYLKSTLRYRYYDYHSNQQPMTISGLLDSPDAAGLTTETAQPLNFTKQNASADLAWQPFSWLTVGPGYAWEHWSRGDYADTSVTGENIAKGFADAKWGWSTLRTSIQYGWRRYEVPYIGNTANNPASGAFKVLEYANRDRFQGMASWAVQVTRMLEVTPNGGFRNDDYQTDPFRGVGIGDIGITHDNSWNAGVDVAVNFNSTWAVYFSYNHENNYLQIYENSATPTLNMQTTDYNDTFIVGGKVTVIPEKLFVNANYTYALSKSVWTSDCTAYGCLNNPQPTFPTTHNKLQRLDVTAKYMLDDYVVPNAGWSAKPFVKLRLLWERNSSDNWQTVAQQLGWAINNADNTTTRAVFLATGNPNYNVVMGQVSVGLKW